MGQVGLKRKEISKHRVSLKGLPISCGRLFLDSGAHSLYTRHSIDRRGSNKFKFYVKRSGNWTRRFKNYLDDYAKFVLDNKGCFDVQVTVDVIRNPELSWQSWQYLRDKGLRTMPVVHGGANLKWVEKYLKAGCKYVGIGGPGPECTLPVYVKWADHLFDFLCPYPSRLPVVKTHGFALTSIPLIIRYPWYSVDSSRWAKAAGYSSILVPLKTRNGFDFRRSYLVCFSHRKESRKITGPHIKKLRKSNPIHYRGVLDWLDEIGLPLGKATSKGKVIEYGVYSQYHARAVANLKFFQRLQEWMPPWPWPFKVQVGKGLFEGRSPTHDREADHKQGRLRIYLAGGSPIVETSLKKPNILMSAFVDVKNGKPCSRLARLMELRKQARSK